MADDKMGEPEIFADDHVQAGFPGTCHAHGQGQKIEHMGVRRIMGRDLLITAHSGEVVKIPGPGFSGSA